MFSPLVARWLEQKFTAPTPAQTLAWPAIAAGRDVLVVAATGAGKTLAAFTFFLDSLVRQAERGALEPGTQVLYVSPLKALSNDVRKNLESPLAEIRDLAEVFHVEPPAITTAVRTGDTPASERLRMAKKPPHVVVTTPESLYLLLTSKAGRRMLRTVRAVIVDEIHAVLGDKRGAHLALSLSRLDALVTDNGLRLPQRIGLSATVNPLDEAAKFLMGRGRPAPVIVTPPPARERELTIETTRSELSAVASHEQWAEVYERIIALANEVRTTLVFVPTRKLAERTALHLGERMGKGLVAAHHGSLAHHLRLAAEERLKAGDLRVMVATASLELGIDIGTVDRVCIIGAPRTIGTALQRIGRAGHQVGSVSKGTFFPMTRDQLIECLAIVRSAERGAMDVTRMRAAPIDVLCQQIVAMVACEALSEDAVFERVRAAAPYMDLERSTFDQVVGMLSEGFAPRLGRGRGNALLHRDLVARELRARRSAKLVAITNGGAIPDIASYDVVESPEGTRVGSLDEDFAIESSAGDIFLLGTTSWRILRQDQTKVWVENARGAPPTVPFWLGEGPSRSPELSEQVGSLRDEVVAHLTASGRDATAAWLSQTTGVDAAGAALACDYLAEGHAELGAVPTKQTVIAERFFDDSGGTQLVLHAPFGARLNRAWGLALRKRFCRAFDFELQAVATDDGLLFSLGPQHSFPLESLFEMVDEACLDEVLTQAALQAPMFGTRFRWNAGRALALPKTFGGKKVPPFRLRMMSDDLLAAVFPEQTGCQDNHGGMPLSPPDHPLVNETLRDCLTEVMDMPGLREVIGLLRAGHIRTVCRETAEPSVFAHEIIHANPYAFLDDAPLEERRTRAVSVRRGLSASLPDRLGALDPALVAEVITEAQREVRDADEMCEFLSDLVAVPDRFFDEGIPTAPARRPEAAKEREWLADLVRQGRVTRVRGKAMSEAGAWVAVERRPLVEVLWPGAQFEPDHKAPFFIAHPEPEQAMIELVRPWMSLMGPTTAPALAAWLGVDPADVDIAFARLELQGQLMRGKFLLSHDGPSTEWCDRVLVARIQRRTLDGLRKAIEPVMPADYVRFLCHWQHVAPGAALEGREGLLRVLAQLQGFEAAAAAWERDILPARVRGYKPAWLDELCFAGEIAWGRLGTRRALIGPTRATPITFVLRQEMTALFKGSRVADTVASESGSLQTTNLTFGPTAEAILDLLRRKGALFFDDLVKRTGAPAADVEEALWQLVAGGQITGDGWGGMRALIDRSGAGASIGGAQQHIEHCGIERPPTPWHVGNLRGPTPRAVTGRFSLLDEGDADDEPEASATDRKVPDWAAREAAWEPVARQYLRRYGVVTKNVLGREPHAPPWRELLRIYRRLEMRGEIRGGRFVASYVGEQFALPEAVESLRALRRRPPERERIVVSSCDPLNLVGLITPGNRVPAAIGAEVAYVNGIPERGPDEPADEARASARTAEELPLS